MSAITFIFTRDIDTPRLSVKAGMPVPSKYDKYALHWFRREFGDDIVKPLDYSKPEEFSAILSEEPKKYLRLQALCVEQKKELQSMSFAMRELHAKVKELEKENAELKRAASSR